MVARISIIGWMVLISGLGVEGSNRYFRSLALYQDPQALSAAVDEQHTGWIAWTQKSGDVKTAHAASFTYDLSILRPAQQLSKFPEWANSISFQARSGENVYLLWSGYREIDYKIFRGIIKYDRNLLSGEMRGWDYSSTYLATGRAIDQSDILFLGGSNSGNFVNGNTLFRSDLFWIKQATQVYEGWYTFPSGYYDDLTIAMRADGSFSSAIAGSEHERDYEFVMMREFSRTGALLREIYFDTVPDENKLNRYMTATATNEYRKILVSWSWYPWEMVNQHAQPTAPARTCFSVIDPGKPPGPVYEMARQSTDPDRNDLPTAALFPDGSGAIAWTTREGNESKVWLQRINSLGAPMESPRLIDGRMGYHPEKPQLAANDKGLMFLLWKSVGRLSSHEIHILDLKAFNNPSSELNMVLQNGNLSFEWEVLPGTITSLQRLDYPGDTSPELVDEKTGTFGQQQHTQAIGNESHLFRLLRR